MVQGLRGDEKVKEMKSPRGKLMSDCDKLLSRIIRYERGGICEVHNRVCKGIGASHILSKASHPKLRYVRKNILLACWFGAHYYHHHDPDDIRAIRYKEAVIRKLGKDYKRDLLILEKIQPKLTTFRLSLLKVAFMEELKTYEKISV